MAVYAVGIDLAWSPRNPSGIAVAEADGGSWVLREAAAGLTSNHDILEFIRGAVGTSPAIVAIDAPLVVRRWNRGRDGDRLVTRLFGPMEAGVYPATRQRIGGYGGKRIWDLVRDLEREGFRHDCRVTPGAEDRVFFETYPHAATVALFGLRKTLKYKPRERRSYAVRWREFGKLHGHLRSLSGFDPALVGVEPVLQGVRGVRGSALKNYEDSLDGILCAYIAAYYWTWGTERCAIMGTLADGYIVTPMTPAIAKRAPPGSRIFRYGATTTGRRSPRGEA